MIKKSAVKIAILLAALICIFGLASCDNLPDDYVEVESLRIAQANVFLSPSGDTNSHQLEVEILPADATNKKLNYYVPSEYLKYIRVSEAGLITAVQVTPEGEGIPLRVTSTTNSKAYLTVNVVVEYVEVKEINFNPGSVSLLYNSSGIQLEPIFTPRHAQDGRAVSYRTINDGVATVNSSGYLTPVGAGYTHVLAEGRTTAGKTVTGYLEVEVRYNAGRYRLEVSDSAPQYNQIIGDFKAINFNLMVLDEHSDPNITVLWYVDSERVVSMNNQLQYQHIPSVNTRTSYRVSVRVSTKHEKEQIFYSEPITVFNPFKGFTLKFENLTSARQSYQYGDIGVFSPTEGSSDVVTYEWYLRRLGETGYGTRVAVTSAAQRDLTRRLNVEGDFVLTAAGQDVHGNTVTIREFEFGVTRFAEGDTLLISPVLIDDGMPPESYDYYVYICDENGEKLSVAQYIGASLTGDVFQYALNGAGRYKLACTAISEGIIASVDGAEFIYETDLIRVYGRDDAEETGLSDLVQEGEEFDAYRVAGRERVSGVSIGGIRDGTAYKPIVRWDNVKGICSYVAEITTEDGRIHILDSDSASGAAFGDDYLIIPEEYATLGDRFSVRIKLKGSLFGPRCYYGYPAESGREEYYFDAVGEEYYSYLVPVDGIDTAYLLSMRDLGALLNYVALYAPVNNDLIGFTVRTIEGVDYNAFSFRAYMAFDIKATSANYPVEVPEGVADNLISVYKAVLGAQNAYCPAGIYRYIFEYHDQDGSYTVTVMLPVRASGVLATEPAAHIKGSSPNYSKTPYGAGNTDFAINLRREKQVADSDQLYLAAERGMRPAFASDAMRVLYNKALAVVNSIIGKDMTDFEKALAFFDYLTANVIYDSALAALSETPDADLYRYAGFKLEGVFDYGQAVCDGVSKAFVLLCAIEGIPCVRVAGIVNGAAHAWNKVLIDDDWYIVDVTNGALNEGGTLYANHAFFLLSDAEYGSMAEYAEYGEYPAASVGYGYYENVRINGLSAAVRSQDDLNALINSFTDRLPAPLAFDVLFDESFASGGEEIAAAVARVTPVTSNTLSSEIILLNGNRAILRIE